VPPGKVSTGAEKPAELLSAPARTEPLGARPLTETFPAGVPALDVTATVAVTVLPWVMLAGESVSEVCVVLSAALDQPLTRLATSTLPRPEAVS
jgi:hypothetical protein